MSGWTEGRDFNNKQANFLIIVQYTLIKHRSDSNQGTDHIAIFTARKRSLQRLCFYTCLSFPDPIGRLGFWQVGEGVSRPRPKGEVGGGGLGVQAQAREGCPGPRWCIPAYTEADTPPPEQTATAAGGTHPTGMHSCCFFVFWLSDFFLKSERLNWLCIIQ